MSPKTALVVNARECDIAALTPLAREGFVVEVTAGAGLRQTLVQDLGLGEACVDTRIQAVFLDGSPVDDIDTEQAREGCTLALAGALPGVAGICMQRGSRIGVFREGITHAAGHATGHAAGPSSKPLRITLKLFNVIAEECLAQVLARGVELRAGRLAELLDERPHALAEAALALNGAAVTRSQLLDALRGQDSPLRLVAEIREDR